MKIPSLIVSVGLTVSVFAIGCGHNAVKPSAVPTTGMVTTTLSPASPGKTTSTIYISDRLRQACAISTIESVKEAPKFDFDRQAILPEDQDVLAQIAQCLTTGALKGQSVKLVGRADPRGTPEYNMALGARRSDAVLKYLGNLGVGTPQMKETSRGSLDATGSDESTWQTDRRVDVDLI